MRQLPEPRPDPNLLIGTATADDAGVYRLTRDLALVQTADFFTPIVDDAAAFGEIAAANSLSDVYAMGGRPLTALNILGVPPDKVPPSVIAAILRGGLKKATEAGCSIVGGHTIRLPEPMYGLSVTGLVSPRRIIANSQARPGDLLVLTKPLGTGIVTTAIKLGIAEPRIQKRAINLMRHLNVAGAELGEKQLVHAGTDVTGFGLLGHLSAMCTSSGTSAEINSNAVPVIGPEVFDLMRRNAIPGGTKDNLRAADSFSDWGRTTNEQKLLLTDAQTSGGLLLCVPEKYWKPVLAILKRHRSPCIAVIGRMVRSRRPQIKIQA